jgi:hypothetical protein
MPKALNSRPCPHNSSTQKSESTLEGLNLLNRSPTKSRRSKPSFNNLSNPSPLDLTISNETMMTVGATAKDDEEVTEATLATMGTMAMATILVAKAKTTQVGVNIPTTQISPVSYMEGDTVQKIVIHSNGKLANSSHLAAISNNETRTAITSPTSTIASLSTIERLSSVCQDSTTLRLLVQLTSADPSTGLGYQRLHHATQRKAAQLSQLQTRGSITLTDCHGNKQTLNDLVYIPECSDQSCRS